MTTWHDKANRLIADMCTASYRHMNPKQARRHTPYAVPALAQALVECLGTNDEATAKRIFLDLASDAIPKEYQQ